MTNKGFFIVVSAPSGAGKSSMCRRLLEAYPEIKFSVSCTSREPRPNEINGKDYHFISRDEFQRRIDENEFVEWIENYGDFYGTSIKSMEDLFKEGQDLLLDIEPRGAKKVKLKFKKGIYVFILPPSRADLLKRLEKRGHETEEAIKARFAQADSEFKEISWYDYVIFNDDLETAATQLIAIYVAEKCKRNRLKDKLKEYIK